MVDSITDIKFVDATVDFVAGVPSTDPGKQTFEEAIK